MAEQDQSKLRLDSMKVVFPDYEAILEDFKQMLAGFLPGAEIDIYDNFMDQEGFVWDTQTNTYIPKQIETDIRPVQWLQS